MVKLKRGFPIVLARIVDGPAIVATGREGETLLRLVEKGSRGLRAYDFAGGPPFRLGAYIHDLRGMGLAIRTDREEHATGWHAVYVLETAVRIVKVDDGQPKGQAA
ncbi:MAG: hypothetical protein NTZ14_08360 [Hyphomicrobiales bacterium]|nr:hypothetical protein [Hyphomicrobiales bacterium]